MRGKEEVLRTGDPLDLGDWGAIDDALRLSAESSINGAEGHALTFLLRRVYRWEMGSHQITSPVEKPMMMSMWPADLVMWFTSWQRQCALVKRILVRYSG